LKELFDKVRALKFEIFIHRDSLAFTWIDHIRKMPPNAFPNKKVKGKGQMGGPRTRWNVRILDRIIWDFIQAKRWSWWRTVMRVWWLLNLELQLPCNSHGNERVPKKRS